MNYIFVNPTLFNVVVALGLIICATMVVIGLATGLHLIWVGFQNKRATTLRMPVLGIEGIPTPINWEKPEAVSPRTVKFDGVGSRRHYEAETRRLPIIR